MFSYTESGRIAFFKIVWDVVVSELPATRERIVALIEELGAKSEPEA